MINIRETMEKLFPQKSLEVLMVEDYKKTVSRLQEECKEKSDIVFAVTDLFAERIKDYSCMVQDLLKYCDSIDDLCRKEMDKGKCVACSDCPISHKQMVCKRIRKIIGEKGVGTC